MSYPLDDYLEEKGWWLLGDGRQLNFPASLVSEINTAGTVRIQFRCMQFSSDRSIKIGGEFGGGTDWYAFCSDNAQVTAGLAFNSLGSNSDFKINGEDFDALAAKGILLRDDLHEVTYCYGTFERDTHPIYPTGTQTQLPPKEYELVLNRSDFDNIHLNGYANINTTFHGNSSDYYFGLKVDIGNTGTWDYVWSKPDYTDDSSTHTLSLTAYSEVFDPDGEREQVDVWIPYTRAWGWRKLGSEVRYCCRLTIFQPDSYTWNTGNYFDVEFKADGSPDWDAALVWWQSLQSGSLAGYPAMISHLTDQATMHVNRSVSRDLAYSGMSAAGVGEPLSGIGRQASGNNHFVRAAVLIDEFGNLVDPDSTHRRVLGQYIPRINIKDENFNGGDAIISNSLGLGFYVNTNVASTYGTAQAFNVFQVNQYDQDPVYGGAGFQVSQLTGSPAGTETHPRRYNHYTHNPGASTLTLYDWEQAQVFAKNNHDGYLLMIRESLASSGIAEHFYILPNHYNQDVDDLRQRGVFSYFMGFNQKTEIPKDLKEGFNIKSEFWWRDAIREENMYLDGSTGKIYTGSTNNDADNDPSLYTWSNRIEPSNGVVYANRFDVRWDDPTRYTGTAPDYYFIPDTLYLPVETILTFFDVFPDRENDLAYQKINESARLYWRPLWDAGEENTTTAEQSGIVLENVLIQVESEYNQAESSQVTVITLTHYQVTGKMTELLSKKSSLQAVLSEQSKIDEIYSVESKVTEVHTKSSLIKESHQFSSKLN